MPYRVGMPQTFRLLALLVVASLALVGCVPGDQPAPSPAPTEAAVFASEEEALAAAEEVYGNYLATLDAIFEDGGENPERLLDFASPEVFEQEAAGFERFQSQKLRGLGASTFTARLQSYEAIGSVTIYVCEDISNTDVLGHDGASVVAPDRTNQIPYEVTVAGTPLRVVMRDVWPMGDICG